MMKVRHKTPCSECPFRRTSAAGWLGGSSAAAWKSVMDTEGEIQCHMDAKKEKDRKAFCAGHMIHMRNSFKVPRDRDYANAVDQYKPNKEVFRWQHEFIEHHANGLLAEFP